MLVFPDKFCFGTKAETLERLGPQLTKCHIPDHWRFPVSDWRKNPEKIIAAIAQRFGDKKIIIRSSTLAEDQCFTAMAGAFLSIADISPAAADELKDAIERVIASYSRDEAAEETLDNQVLIQVQIHSVSMSGVLFTHDLNTGAPYYVINYDDETARTDSVTSGNGYRNRTLLIHRKSWRNIGSSRFYALLEAVNEIENCIKHNFLDIEFALGADDQVYLFQVRRITTQPNWNRGLTLRIEDAILRAGAVVAERFRALPGVLGDSTIFGRMPDWNPAEIIGSAPRRLALSLYRYLIMDRAWRVARAKMGYSEPMGWPLMIALGGQPFVDVRLSFHSYLPSGLPETIGKKLVNAWLARLQANPHLHDKVEFDVAITTLSFDFEQRVNAQFPDILDAQELTIFKDQLGDVTRSLLNGSLASVKAQLKLINSLPAKRKNHLAGMIEPNLAVVSALLEDCIEFGTIPFAILARHAFIAESFLKSLVGRGVFTNQEIERLRRSIATVAGEFIRDLEQLNDGKMDKDLLLERYGHLRPGTYDILSLRYDQRDEAAIVFNREQTEQLQADPFILSDTQQQGMTELLAEYSFDQTPDELLDYFRAAIQGREYAKFIFTRSISDALEIISAWGERTGLSREELSHIDIRHILDILSMAQGRTTEDYLRRLSVNGKNEHEVAIALRLPHLISRPSDLTIIPLMLDHPNFITSKKVSGPWVRVTGAMVNPQEIDNKIVVIESADPGFDWIFARHIHGLITKFGGANSHMSIRCAEFGLPAAIGCGEQIFDQVLQSRYIEINCAEERIVPIC
ncbi:MAG: pyruvate phosphate dikinase [Magnetococcales bacterium]|nr:pyruvate phosphate dikinase [Magnetococcales bacterium]